MVAAARAGETPDEPLAIDLDATLITAHSDDKDGAAPTYKRGFLAMEPAPLPHRPTKHQG